MMRHCCDSPGSNPPLEPNTPAYPHIRGCKHYIPTPEDGLEELARHNRETIPGFR